MRLTSFTAATVAVMAGSALLVAAPGASSADPTPFVGVRRDSRGGQESSRAAGCREHRWSSRRPGAIVPAEAGPLAAGGVLTVTAGDDHATAKVTDLTLGTWSRRAPGGADEPVSQQLQQACDAAPAGPAEDVDEQIFGELPVSCRSPSTRPEPPRPLRRSSDGDVRRARRPSTRSMSSATTSRDRARLGRQPLRERDSAQRHRTTSARTPCAPGSRPAHQVTLNRQTTEGRGLHRRRTCRLAGRWRGRGRRSASTTCGEASPRQRRGRAAPRHRPPRLPFLSRAAPP